MEMNASERESVALSFVRSDLATVSYKPVEALPQIAAEIGLPIERLVKLDANENVYGAPAEVVAAVSASASEYHIYPDPTQALLRSAIASTLHKGAIDPSQVVCGAGSDDVLDIMIRLVGPRTVVQCEPTFGMYSFLGRIFGSEIVSVKRRENFDIDWPQLLLAVAAAIEKSPANPVMVFLASPNNPTGNVVEREQLIELCGLRAVVVVDEAYADFMQPPSAVDLLPRFPNLIVCRTFSKWAGLAGLRVGYGVCHPALANKMMAIKQPYNISASADAAARAAIQHRAKIQVSIDALVEQRDFLFRQLSKFTWLRALPSEANFILCEILPGRSASKIAAALRRQGMLIRFFGSQGGDLTNHIRISAGTPQQMRRILDALHVVGCSESVCDPRPPAPLLWELAAAPAAPAAALPQVAAVAVMSEPELTPCELAARDAVRRYGAQALLFDMDGVLADVALSYRQAIVDTASSFGVAVTAEDINQCKARGNANNDWILTHNLIIAKLGPETPPPTLEAVTARFEAIYQGSDDALDGLWRRETLLVPRAILARLADLYPLAIVTGRPRRDCDRFLQHFDLVSLFKAAVCMEDAPLKPDPAPVQRALQLLKVERALMFGDTRDDMVAAFASGVLPVGILVPGAGATQTELLERSGAAFVLAPGMSPIVSLIV